MKFPRYPKIWLSSYQKSLILKDLKSGYFSREQLRRKYRIRHSSTLSRLVRECEKYGFQNIDFVYPQKVSVESSILEPTASNAAAAAEKDKNNMNVQEKNDDDDDEVDFSEVDSDDSSISDSSSFDEQYPASMNVRAPSKNIKHKVEVNTIGIRDYEFSPYPSRVFINFGNRNQKVLVLNAEPSPPKGGNMKLFGKPDILVGFRDEVVSQFRLTMTYYALGFIFQKLDLLCRLCKENVYRKNVIRFVQNSFMLKEQGVKVFVFISVDVFSSGYVKLYKEAVQVPLLAKVEEPFTYENVKKCSAKSDRIITQSFYLQPKEIEELRTLFPRVYAYSAIILNMLRIKLPRV